MKFSIKDFFSNLDQICRSLVAFTEEILNGKLHFLCSASQFQAWFEIEVSQLRSATPDVT